MNPSDPMDHAAAHDRIEDLLLEPARLADLSGSTDPADVALREHIADCLACRADLESWRDLQRSIADALPAGTSRSGEAAARAAVLPVELPPSLRAATLHAIRPVRSRSVVPITAAPSTRLTSRSRPRLSFVFAIAAALVIVAGAGFVTIDQIGQRDAAQADARALDGALAAVNRVLAAPDHKAVPLTAASGVPAGSISWSSHDLVVLTTALVQPDANHVYKCWLSDGGTYKAIGSMDFAGRTAYWVGTLDDWATFQIGPTTKFVVTLEPVGGTQHTGTDVLSANLGS